MKKCQICGKRASIYLTQIINGQASDLALCEECARTRGIFDPQSLTFAEKFFPEAFKKRVDKIVRELISKAEESDGNEKALHNTDFLTRCPSCRFTLADFRNTGRLGCPDCYSVFANELEQPSEGVQEQEGTGEEQKLSPALQRSRLEQQLQAAIEREDYETAAALRDKLKEMN